MTGTSELSSVSGTWVGDDTLSAARDDSLRS